MHLINGKVMFVQEWDYYHNFKPSILLRIWWFFWPTMFLMNWRDYHMLSRDECEVGVYDSPKSKEEQ